MYNYNSACLIQGRSCPGATRIMYKDLEKRRLWRYNYIRRLDVRLRRAEAKRLRYATDEEYRERMKATAREWQARKRAEAKKAKEND